MRYYIILIFILISITVHGQGFLKVNGRSITNAKGNEFIFRGVGLGGWMLQEPYMMQLSGFAVNQRDIKNKVEDLIGADNTQKFYDAWLTNHCTKADIDSLAAWGLNSIRLPLHYNLFTLPIEQEPVAGKNTWLKKGFQLTDSLLSWCKANKIYLILDLHAAPGGQGNDAAISDMDKTKPSLWQSEANKQKTIALWQKLATHYAKEEWIAGYDVINEPNWGFQNEADKNGCAETENKPLKKLLQDITAAIRKVDKKHIIYIEGNCWANNFEGIFPLWDNNMVVSFHKYWNSTSDGSIKKFLDYREKYNLPIWMGETGENSNSWVTDAIELFERNKIGWTLWPLKKSGLNNPLQVKINSGYQQILDYWKGTGTRPTKEAAMQSLMEYAAATKIQNNVFRRDFTDAITRQIKNAVSVPFKKITIEPNSILFATDYDMGHSGDAYYDKDAATYWVEDNNHVQWNKGQQYRNEGVDIEQCKDSISNGFNIGWIEDGEWLQYTVYTPVAGSFDVNVRAASNQSNGRLQLIINGTATGENIVIPKTTAYQLWETSTIKNIAFTQGWNKIRVLAVKGGFNLNYLKFIQTNHTAKLNSF